MKKFLLLLLAACLTGSYAFPLQAQDEPAVEEKAEDPFAVPEGVDSNELQLFLRKLARTPPPERTPEAILAHLKKMEGAFAEIMGRKVEEEVFLMAAQLRLEVLGLMPQFGDNTGVLKRTKILEALKQDPREGVKALAARIEVEERIARIPALPAAARAQLVSELGENLKGADMSDPEKLNVALSQAMQAAQMLEQFGDTENAKTAYTSYVEIIKAKKISELDELVTRLEGFVRKMSLPGNPIEIKGKTLSGKDFDIKQYKGKVVLVDFWATWCGPCIAELPNVKEMYDAYHDKGFEVIGISLDDNRDSLVEFIKNRDLKWETIFFDEPENQGWENPIANHYGITGIPAVFLVNQEGNVVHLNARDELLREELAKLLGPIEEKPAAN